MRQNVILKFFTAGPYWIGTRLPRFFDRTCFLHWQPYTLALILFRNHGRCSKYWFWCRLHEFSCIFSVRKLLSSSLGKLLLLLTMLKSLSLLSNVLPLRFILAVRAVMHLYNKYFFVQQWLWLSITLCITHGTRTCIKRKKIDYGKFFDFCAEKCVYN